VSQKPYKLVKEVGDKIEADDEVQKLQLIRLIARCSEVSGILVEQLFAKDDLVLVGQTIAIIETEGGEMVAVVKAAASQEAVAEVTKQLTLLKIVATPVDFSDSDKFFPPLVKILLQRGMLLNGTNQWYRKDGRVTKMIF
jgi:2-oxoglutarate dehydrogenase E2 component (dihydrolipoamide succinyltransferase)